MSYWQTYQTRKELPITCGVYVLYKDNQVIYVGVSKDIRKRFSNHTIQDWDVCKIKATTSFGAANVIEEKLIQKLKPKYNSYLAHRTELGRRHRVTIDHGIYIRFREFCNNKGLKIKNMTNDILEQFLKAVEDTNAKQV